jgi:hypothetical protein
MTISKKSKLSALTIAGVIAAGATLVVAPGAHAAQSDFVIYMDRSYREVIDVGTAGDSHGDITVSNGSLSQKPGGKSVGTYATSQVTVIMDIPGGRQNRNVDMSFMLGKDAIYSTALIEANGGTPPRKASAFAIVGGTGKYAGAAGELMMTAISPTRYKVTLHLMR